MPFEGQYSHYFVKRGRQGFLYQNDPKCQLIFLDQQLISDTTYSSYLSQNADTAYPKVWKLNYNNMYDLIIKFLVGTIEKNN